MLLYLNSFCDQVALSATLPQSTDLAVSRDGASGSERSRFVSCQTYEAFMRALRHCLEEVKNKIREIEKTVIMKSKCVCVCEGCVSLFVKFMAVSYSWSYLTFGCLLIAFLPAELVTLLTLSSMLQPLFRTVQELHEILLVGVAKQDQYTTPPTPTAVC